MIQQCGLVWVTRGKSGVRSQRTCGSHLPVRTKKNVEEHEGSLQA